MKRSISISLASIIVSGKSVFQKSALEAISKSFPVTFEEALFDFPKEFRVKLSYTLR